MTTASSSNTSTGKIVPHVVLSDERNMRLDRWFRRRFPGLSQGQIQKCLRTGQIRVNGKRAEAEYKIDAGDEIRIPPQFSHHSESVGQKDRTKPVPKVEKKFKELVIYQDDDVIVLNKPAGLAVQGGTGLKENLDDFLICLSRDGKTKPKLVHRLDKDTSGVLLVARTDYAARMLTASFRERETQKIYWAVVLGSVSPERGTINVPIVKCGESMKVSHGDAEERTAITVYKVVEKAGSAASFVALRPVTGRTHQLRVHMAHKGNPILGDRIYGAAARRDLPVGELGKGLHLHARRIVIPHPRKGIIDIAAPLNKEMKKTWAWFGFDECAEVDVEYKRRK